MTVNIKNIRRFFLVLEDGTEVFLDPHLKASEGPHSDLFCCKVVLAKYTDREADESKLEEIRKPLKEAGFVVSLRGSVFSHPYLKVLSFDQTEVSLDTIFNIAKALGHNFKGDPNNITEEIAHKAQESFEGVISGEDKEFEKDMLFTLHMATGEDIMNGKSSTINLIIAVLEKLEVPKTFVELLETAEKIIGDINLFAERHRRRRCYETTENPQHSESKAIDMTHKIRADHLYQSVKDTEKEYSRDDLTINFSEEPLHPDDAKRIRTAIRYYVRSVAKQFDIPIDSIDIEPKNGIVRIGL